MGGWSGERHQVVELGVVREAPVDRAAVPEHVGAAKVHRLEVDPLRPGSAQLPEDAE